MLYLNRQLESLSPLEWKKLFLNANYTLIQRTHVRHWAVETSWVGVAMSWEEPAKVFLTAICGRHDPLAVEKEKADEYLWAETELKALKNHRQLTERLKNGGLGRTV